MARTVFFISDGTGITAETLGHSLLSQFEEIEFKFVTIPYVNNLEKAGEALTLVNEAIQADQPIVFSTIINPEISSYLRQLPVLIIDLFQTFISPLEAELGCKSSHTVGRSHGVTNYADYMGRINAINYTLAHDDGTNTKNYATADVILIGVSRCGKTPTSLYLALQNGIYAANYPLTPEVLNHVHLPPFLQKYEHKLFGLTIDAKRLQKIRAERFPNKSYSSPAQCEKEVETAQQLFREHNIPFLDTTLKSIEEIATEIRLITKIHRRV